ncbi:MAG: DUF362 domain-containing protein [Candidatus Eiseniibacteriota bacterium]
MTPRSQVAVLFTKPETVVEDTKRVMDLAGIQEALPVGPEVSLRINISWHVYMPACSTTPWQLDAVIGKLLEQGHARERIYAAQNRTVVVDCRVGAVNNNLQPVLDRYGVEIAYLNEKPTRWVKYEPRAKMRVLNDVFPKGILVPQRLIGSSVIHMPTLKTHVFTTTTGAMKNAFGGLLQENRHWTHAVIHETLVDLLAIQKEIHPGLFAVMDGTVAGDGPGPRAMRPKIANLLLASRDMVAIDAIAAKLMGIDPMGLKFIRLAHESGLGVGNPSEIEILGDDVKGVNLQFSPHEDTLASRGQKLIYWGPLKPLEHFLLRTPIVPWAYAASRLYHDAYWYPFVGKPRVEKILESGWGKLFQSYGAGRTVADDWNASPAPASEAR